MTQTLTPVAVCNITVFGLRSTQKGNNYAVASFHNSWGSAVSRRTKPYIVCCQHNIPACTRACVGCGGGVGGSVGGAVDIVFALVGRLGIPPNNMGLRVVLVGLFCTLNLWQFCACFINILVSCTSSPSLSTHQQCTFSHLSFASLGCGNAGGSVPLPESLTKKLSKTRKV